MIIAAIQIAKLNIPFHKPLKVAIGEIAGAGFKIEVKKG